MSRRIWPRVLRGLVSVGLVAWLLARVHYPSLRTTLADARVFWFVAPHLLIVLTVVCSAVKWRLLLRTRGIEIPLSSATRIYYTGLLFNQFLPTTVGGDVARVAMVTRLRGKQRWASIAASVLMERIVGLWGLVIVLAVAVAINYTWVASLHLILPLALASAAIIGASTLVFHRAGQHIFELGQRIPFARPVVRFLNKVRGVLVVFRNDPGAILVSLGLSCVFYVLGSMAIYMLTFAFSDVRVPWSTPIVAFCAMSLLGLLPVAINGIGLLETGYVLLFSSLGFTHNHAVVLAFAIRAFAIVSACVGGLILLVHDRGPRRLPAEPGTSIQSGPAASVPRTGDAHYS